MKHIVALEAYFAALDCIFLPYEAKDEPECHGFAATGLAYNCHAFTRSDGEVYAIEYVCLAFEQPETEVQVIYGQKFSHSDLRIQHVPQSVAQQIEAQYGKQDCYPRSNRYPPEIRQEFGTVIDHAAQICRWRLHSEPKEREARADEDYVAHVQRHLREN